MQPPDGGLKRSVGFQEQEPYFTPECANVMPLPGRPGLRRRGSRPGLQNLTHDYLPSGSGQPINMLGIVSGAIETRRRYVRDSVDALGVLPEGWETSVGGLVTPNFDTHNHLYIYDYNASNPRAGAFYSALGQDTTQQFSISMIAVPWRSQHRGTYRLYLLMDDTTPSPSTAGYVIEFTVATDDNITGTIYKMQGGIAINTWSGSYDFNAVDARELRVLYDPSGPTIKLYASTVQLLSQAVSTAPTGSGTRCGWSMQPTASGYRAMVAQIHIDYILTNPLAYKDMHRAVFAAGGHIYHQRLRNQETPEIDSNYRVNTDRIIHSAQRLKHLYIADNSELIYEDTDAVVSDLGTGPYYWQFTSNPEINLASTYGVDDYNYIVEVVELRNGSTVVTRTDFATGTYSAAVTNGASVTDSRMSLLRYCTTRPSAALPTAVNYAHIRIWRAPKRYDHAAETIGRWESSLTVAIDDTTTPVGTLPPNFKFVGEYRDRLVVAGPGSYFAFSKVGDPLNWYFDTDLGNRSRAIDGSAAEVGQIGHEITALAAWIDEFMFFGTADHVYRIDGDPAGGGRIVVASRDQGIVGGRAWCVGPGDVFYHLGRAGLNRIVPGGYSQPLGRDRVPNELLNLDPNHVSALMEFDARLNGIWLFVTGTMKLRRASWFIDVETGAFWPIDLPDFAEPLGLARARGFLDNEDRVLLGCRDGKLRAFHRWGRTDDGNAVSSYLTWGPIRGTVQESELRLDEVVVAAGEESEDFTLAVYPAATAEAAVRAATLGSASFTATLRRGLNRGIQPRLRGAAFCLRTYSTQPWAIDELSLIGSPVGRVQSA